MVGLYFLPIISIFSKKGFIARLEEATLTWIKYLSIFTAVFFQIPHNLMAHHLNSMKGEIFEWAFASYALSDSRWNNYTHNSLYGLAPEVWLINWNDSLLSLIVLFFMILAFLFRKSKSANKFNLIFILSVLFRYINLKKKNQKANTISSHSKKFFFDD